MADISANCSPEIDGAFSMNIALRIREIPRQIRRIGKMTFRKRCGEGAASA
jgi:hypothetical protein